MGPQLLARGIGLTAVAAGLGLLAGCGAPPPATRPAPEVIVDTVAKRDLPVTLSYPARVAGSRVVEVRARVNGTIIARTYTEGQVVKQGALLFRIDPATYQAAYDSATAELESARADVDAARRQFDRVKTLAATGVASQREYDQAAAALAKAQAAVGVAQAAQRQARIDLDYTAVRAPVAGIASKEAVTIGNTVDGKSGAGGDLLTSIVQANPAYAEFSVPEDEYLKLRELARYRPGGVTANITSGSTCKTQGRVDFTDTFVNASTGTIRARAVFENADGCLVSGQFLGIEVAGLTLPGRIAVPKTGVLFGANGPTAWVVGPDDVVAARPLQIHDSWQDDWLVDGGLVPGERIIVEGILKVTPGMKVTPLTRAEAAARAAQRPGGAPGPTAH